MKRDRPAGRALPATTPLPSDQSTAPVSEAAVVADAVHAIADPTEIDVGRTASMSSQAAAAGLVDVVPAPIVDAPASVRSGADAVAEVAETARVDAVRDPLIAVPGTVALPPDQITPKLAVSEVVSSAAVASKPGSWEEAFDHLALRVGDIEDRLLQSDRTSGERFAGVEAEDAFRRSILGAVADPQELRTFPVAYAVAHDGRTILPGDPEGVTLTFDQHAPLFGNGAIAHDWDSGLTVQGSD